MTLEELAQLLNISPATLRSNFQRTKQNLMKKGVLIWKEGYGKTAKYYVKQMFSD